MEFVKIVLMCIVGHIIGFSTLSLVFLNEREDTGILLDLGAAIFASVVVFPFAICSILTASAIIYIFRGR